MEINKEKPGRGNFIVRVEGKEEPVLELLGSKRPFLDLKALEMEDIGKLVIEALDDEAAVTPEPSITKGWWCWWW